MKHDNLYHVEVIGVLSSSSLLYSQRFITSMTHSATDIGVWLKSASMWNYLEVTSSIPTTDK